MKDDAPFKCFKKLNDFSRPAETVVLLDAHPDLNYHTQFIVPALYEIVVLGEPPVSALWGHLPGSLHRGGAGLAFADGHAVVKHWEDESTKQPVRYKEGWFLADAQARFAGPCRDFEWLARHWTERK